MRKCTLSSLLLLLLGLTGSVFAQKAMELAEATACKCMDAKFDKEASYKVNEKLAEDCLMNAFLDNYDAFATEYSEEKLMDDNFTYKLGEELGINLATNCTTFLEFSIQMVAQENAEESVEQDDKEMMTTGTITKVKDGFVRVILMQTDDGIEEFVWLSEFEGAEDYLSLSSLEGKRLTILWKRTYLFSPADNRYVFRREIVSITK